MMLDYTMMYKANPLLFSAERYDQYPLNPQELIQYLSSASATSNPRPITETDEFDYLLYMDDNIGDRAVSPESGSSNDLKELDLDKKLACEFAIYQTHLKSQTSRKTKRKNFEELLKLDIGSEEWSNEMLQLLESINATNINLSSISDMKIATKTDYIGQLIKDKGNKKKDDELQDIISYIYSNSIRNGINIQPKIEGNENSLGNNEFLKNIIDTMIDLAKSKSNTKDAPGTVGGEEENEDKRIKEMNTALQDLQLAHNFLTKQFENDRLEHSKGIEKLTKTNRELQGRLLDCHSNLTKAESKLREMEEKLMKNKSQTELKDPTIFKDINEIGLSSPTGFDADIASSPVSLDSNGEARGSYSLSIMRNEFRKLLTDTQRKYESEIAKERELTEQLKKKLDQLNK